MEDLELDGQVILEYCNKKLDVGLNWIDVA